MALSKEQLKKEVLSLAANYLIHWGFKDAGFLKAYGMGMGADWLIKQHGDTILDFLSDTYDWMIILKKSEYNMPEALDDYEELKENKAQRLANKILADN